MPKTHRVQIAGIVSTPDKDIATIRANEVLNDIPVGHGSPFWEVQVSYAPTFIPFPTSEGWLVMHNIAITHVVENAADYDAAFPEKVMAHCPRCGVLYDPRRPDRPLDQRQQDLLNEMAGHEEDSQ